MAAPILEGFPRHPRPGRPGDPGLFGPGSVAWRVNGQTTLLLGGGRALLMQVAHPSVAAGVADHSDFPADPYRRLWRTVETMLDITFGDAGAAKAAADRVNEVHRRVEGARADGVPYRAFDPDLLLWVHATLVDSALVVHERFGAGRLSEDDRVRYYREMAAVAEALELPAEALPSDLPAFRAYIDETVAGLEISEQGRRLARDVVSPPLPLPLRPAQSVFRLVSVGLLPAKLREGFGFRWSATHERALRASSAAVRGLTPFLPKILRRWPHAQAAERRLAGNIS